MTDIIIILMDYHTGLPSGKEEIQLSDEDIQMLVEVCGITPTGELIIGPVNNRYKEIVAIDGKSLIMNDKETNEQIPRRGGIFTV